MAPIKMPSSKCVFLPWLYNNMVVLCILYVLLGNGFIKIKHSALLKGSTGKENCTHAKDTWIWPYGYGKQWINFWHMQIWLKKKHILGIFLLLLSKYVKNSVHNIHQKSFKINLKNNCQKNLSKNLSNNMSKYLSNQEYLIDIQLTTPPWPPMEMSPETRLH